jgi:hypothetical protein
MITAVQAFEVAHRAIAGKPYSDAPCDVVIERAGDTYTVTFSPPAAVAGTAAAATPGETTRVLVAAASGTLREVHGATAPTHDQRLAGFITPARAFDVTIRRAQATGVTYDPHGTTSAVIEGDAYKVTLPTEEMPELTEKSDYALRVWVNARTGEITRVLGSS